MKINKTKIPGAFIVELEKKEDERGFLARCWDRGEFKKTGINFSPVQGYITYTLKKGTMRGIHYLTVPEKKLTRVLRGEVYEVVIDLREKFPTFKSWQGFKLVDRDLKMLYIPPGCAHAILTMRDNTEFMSMYNPSYVPGNEKGIRYNDYAFNIKWPIEVKVVSKKDMSWEDFHSQR